VGEPCRRFITNRYPFNRTAAQEVTQDDFGTLFGVGGLFDTAFQKLLLPLVDTGTRPWTFRQNADLKLGGGSPTLGQFQNAAAIRDTFFRNGGKQPALRLDFTPLDMDPGITQFVLDVDGQIVRYAHGPAIATPVQWPGPRGSNQVRIQLTPTTAGASGAVASGPWALFRLLDRMQMESTASPEVFRVAFNVDGRRAIFEVKASSVQNPFRLRELELFRCPSGI
jgi:type VI secretion system protein ImpL